MHARLPNVALQPRRCSNHFQLILALPSLLPMVTKSLSKSDALLDLTRDVLRAQGLGDAQPLAPTKLWAQLRKASVAFFQVQPASCRNCHVGPTWKAGEQCLN